MEDAILVQNRAFNAEDFEMNKHAGGRLIYAEGGIIHVFTEDEHWYLPGRFCMWIPSGVGHKILTSSQHIEVFNIYFPIEAGDAPFYDVTNIYLVNDLLREMLRYTRGWEGEFNQLQHARFTFLKAIKAILPEINPMAMPFPANHPYPKDQGLFEIAQFLNKNLETAYTIEQIAQRFGYSSRTLSRLFKEDLGFSYVRFLRSLRISKAMELMAENKFTIYEIALKVGYNSLSSFSNIFNRVLGIRPAKYMARTNLQVKGEGNFR